MVMAFIIGFLVGGFIGVIVMALITNDDKEI